jgi:hypothetical protein
VALQRAWLAQKRNDFQLPGECLRGVQYGHPESVKLNDSDGSSFTDVRLPCFAVCVLAMDPGQAVGLLLAWAGYCGKT